MTIKGEGHMDPLEAGAAHQAIPQGILESGPNSRASSTGNRQTSNERPTQGTHATGRGDSSNRRHASPGKVHVGQGGNSHGDSDCRDDQIENP